MNASVIDVGPGRAVAGPERSWEVACHLAALAGYLVVLGGVAGPLVVWLLKRAEYPSVDSHGREALNFHLSWLLYTIVCIPFCVVLIGVPVVLLLFVSGVILTIIGGIKASDGELFRYPLTIRFLS